MRLQQEGPGQVMFGAVSFLLVAQMCTVLALTIYLLITFRSEYVFMHPQAYLVNIISHGKTNTQLTTSLSYQTCLVLSTWNCFSQINIFVMQAYFLFTKCDLLSLWRDAWFISKIFNFQLNVQFWNSHFRATKSTWIKQLTV